MEAFSLCPCGSGLSYDACCSLYHQGTRTPENALLLMKSRYSAYARHQYDYIMSTTHPKSRLYLKNQVLWRNEIKRFSSATKFIKLEIFDYSPGTTESFVTFGAYLQQGEADISFKEISRFILENHKWYYMDGQLVPLN